MMHWSIFVMLGVAMALLRVGIPAERRVLPRRWALPVGGVLALLLFGWSALRYQGGDDRTGHLLVAAGLGVLLLFAVQSRGWIGPDT